MNWPRLSLPLLQRELTRRASRKRTYVFRCLCAIALIALAVPSFYGGRPLGALGLSGGGHRMLARLVWFLFLIFVIVMPLLAARSITDDKERQVFDLLLLAGLRPWPIVAQAVISCLVTVGSLLLLALPIAAALLALGGTTTSTLTAAAILLACACLQLAALGVACSAACRTTARATVCAGLIVALAWLLPFLPGAIGTWVERLNPWLLWHRHNQLPWRSLVIESGPAWGLAMAASICAPFLLRLSLEPRTRKRSPGPVSQSRRRSLIPGPPRLPGDRPLAWREAAKTLVGSWRLLARGLLLALSAVSLLLLVAHFGVIHLPGGAWAIANVCISVAAAAVVITKGVDLIASERANETLVVLLTTPMTGEDIINQKVSGTRRFITLTVLATQVLNLGVLLITGTMRTNRILSHVLISTVLAWGWLYVLLLVGVGAALHLPNRVVAWIASWLLALLWTPLLVRVSSAFGWRSLLVGLLAQLLLYGFVRKYFIFEPDITLGRTTENPVCGSQAVSE